MLGAEGEWKETVVEYRGMKIKAYVNEKTGLYACPICGLGERASYFFSERDLLQHIIAHTREEWRKEKLHIAREEEEEGEEIE